MEDASPLQRVGKRLAELRKGAGLSQAEVSQRAGFSIQYVSQLEGGKRNPPLLTILAICDAIGCSPAALLGSLQTSIEPKASGDTRRLIRKIARLPAKERTRVLRAIDSLLGAGRSRR